VFNATDTLFELKFATARSGLPSPLKSPTATETGLEPTATGAAAVKAPVPDPNNTDTLFELTFATARSRLESPSKSPTATETGVVPTPNGEPGAGPNSCAAEAPGASTPRLAQATTTAGNSRRAARRRRPAPLNTRPPTRKAKRPATQRPPSPAAITPLSFVLPPRAGGRRRESLQSEGPSR